MTFFENGSTRLQYEIEGADDGFPVLLLAPGGMHSANELWNRMPWNPRTALRDRYRLIGMDQRNAGSSVAAVSADDGWATYAGDQLALLDHLGIERCHVIGMCIGGPFIMGLLVTSPSRFTSAVVLQAAGISGGSTILRELFDPWAEALMPAHPEAGPADWASFGDRMWSGDFVLAASRDQMAACQTPMLVMMGDDQYHPQAVSREIAALAPSATLVERWKDDEVLSATDATIAAFLAAHTP
jgi:pimeloyl-ACP methyl ester carboxylesterase